AIAGGTLVTADGATTRDIAADGGRMTSLGFGRAPIFVRRPGDKALDLKGGMVLEVRVCNGEFQQIRVFGNVGLAGSQFLVVFCPGYVPNLGDSFTIIDNDDRDPVNGRSQGTHGIAAGQDVFFDVDYRGGDGNDVVFRVLSVGSQTAPNWAIAKTHAPDPFPAGGQGTYTLTVTNNGARSTSGLVTVTDTLPSVFTPSAMSGPGWSCTLATLTCTRSDALAVGASYPPIQLTVNIAADAPSGTFENRAVVSGGGAPNPATTTDPVRVVRGVDLKITKVHPGHFVRGEQGTVTYQVRNVGSAEATAPITVTDVLANGLTSRRSSEPPSGHAAIRARTGRARSSRAASG